MIQMMIRIVEGKRRRVGVQVNPKSFLKGVPKVSTFTPWDILVLSPVSLPKRQQYPALLRS